jgi:hypothetical protein
VRSARRRESACSLHRNLTPSIEASLRTPPPIPRARVLSSWGVTVHAVRGYCHVLQDVDRKSSAFFYHHGVSTPHTAAPAGGFSLQQSCRRRGIPPSCPSCIFVDKKTPDGSPAQQSSRGTPVPPTSPALGRHGPRRDANRVQCLSRGLFLLLLSLEESNQRTLRNRNARFNDRPACRRFRCVRSL